MELNLKLYEKIFGVGFCQGCGFVVFDTDVCASCEDELNGALYQEMMFQQMMEERYYAERMQEEGY